jgi:mono/diheme cytochrome c family protein
MWLACQACSDADGDLPRPYRDLVVPEAMLTSEAVRAKGLALFREYCAICHGERGDGRGPRREGLSGPPRDFTNPQWRASTSPRRVYFAIREGRHGTSMPSWGALSEDETWSVTAYVLSIGGAR